MNLTGRGILLSLFSLIMIVAISCKDDDDDDPNVVFEATLNGMNEVPPNGSTSTGTATLTYDTLANRFDIVVNYTGVAATAAHIHQGAAGVAGGVVFGFSDPVTSPIQYTSPVLTEAQEATLFAGEYYVNIHSSAFPAGEIRGQLVRRP